MKKALLVALFLLLPVVGYFSYALLNRCSSSDLNVASSSEGLAVAKNLYDFSFKRSLADLRGTTGKMKNSLRDNRAFMLDYFVDNARSSSSVRSIARNYGELFDLSKVQFSDAKGYQFSSFGPSGSVAEGVALTTKGLSFSVLDTLKESGSRISIAVQEELLFSELKDMAQILEVELLVMDGSKAVYTTFGDEIQNFGPKEDGTVILNNEIYKADKLLITDDVRLYCLKKSGE